MFRFLFWIIFLAVTFFAGYYFGERHSIHFASHIPGIPSELSNKASHLEQTLKGIRLWMALNDSKDHLNLASAALENKNYGNAVTEVKEAKTKLEKAESLSQGELKKELKPLNNLMTETEVNLIQMNPKAKSQVESAKKTLDKIISK
ncbi:MAG: hypothetical protein HY200_07660 [Nitrospirae bacterium]|nr:hypothetical protein [Nitrospirota bacterium]MBI3594819.1 hypothetical protein [Nitrospirota bacterium]